jgi:HAD superfamily hydrolase (TIGR01509 family)
MGRALILDMDGVIVNSEPIYFAVGQQRYRELGIAIPYEEQLAFVGLPDDLQWAQVKQRFGLSESVPELVAAVRRAYDDYVAAHGYQPMPGIRELIDRMRAAGVTMLVASSSPLKTVAEICDRLGIAGCFAHLVSADAVSTGKPAPDVFLHAAALAGVRPAQCTVIEDSMNGVRAAKAAGMRCIGLHNPDSGNQELAAAGADVVVDSLEQVSVGLVEG